MRVDLMADWMAVKTCLAQLKSEEWAAGLAERTVELMSLAN
eukprot:CAMPEP_0172526034 /NCGR_PEP_ID=MMETSP1067-20121228/1049_1 /TAXON_ID=265564 ORGANISM="Thalassiosira punctigera, Strain Tpunct2005C2" /NCGR_SAMPLE_ID=MMETSP1067 /ASSEMBLY_ACC=CAM_ASM_000444 /LENGTH=40 /DNA_ID= /DNA_START= /DNA_END= /DNA_ORIENTATION=